MGIEVFYRRMPPAEFECLLQDPEQGVLSLCTPLPGFDTAQLAALLDDPAALAAKGPEILAAFEKQSEDPTRVDLQKEWHALHFLLTGESALEPEHRPDDPIHNLAMGGRDTPLETGYGAVRLLAAEDVRSIARALAEISVDDLRGRFSAEAFNQADIYPSPQPGGWNEDEIEGLLWVFPKLVEFFQQADAAGEVVVVCTV